MPKKGKQHVPTEEEAFTTEYMQALNEKFKLRAQLAALTNNLEDLRAHNDRLAFEIEEKEKPQSPPSPKSTPKPRAPIVSPIASTSKKTPPPSSPASPAPALPAPTKPKPVPKATAETQTVQPEPPPLFAEDPILGLPPIISPPKWGVAEDEGISMDDDVVVVKPLHEIPPRQTINSDHNELQEELMRLKRRYEEITLYAIIFIFCLFGFMLLKELRMLFMSRSSASVPKYSTTPPPNVAYQYTPSSAGGDEGDVQLELAFHTNAPSSAHEPEPTPSTPPPPPTPQSQPQITQGYNRITLRPMQTAPCEPRPSVEVKCGELKDLVPKKYDCDECNLNFYGGNQTVIAQHMGVKY